MLKYVIHNHKKLLGDRVAGNFESIVEEYTNSLSKLFKRYSKSVQLEVILSEDDRQYNLTLEINLKSGPLVIKRRGYELHPVAKEAFDTMRREIVKSLQKERKEHLRKHRSQHAR